MSEQDGAPDVAPGDGRVVGGDQQGAPAPAPTDGTGPIERSQGGNRVFAGRYRLLARRGSATDVALFEAVDGVTGRTVAVKIVHPDICARPGFGEQFHETMNRVAGVRHPNLTEVLEVGTATWSGREVHFVVCENLTGGSLRDLRDRGRQLSPSQVVMIGLDACRGLDAAHRAGLVHGDIRPNTLVFGDDGRPRLADLGIAALVSDTWWSDPAGVNIDKAKYASPEQARGDRPVAKSDVYSLDLCLLEAVTGQLPFVGDSSVATLANRVDRLLPVSADLGPLAAVLERAGRPDVDDRSTAAEFGRALHQAAERLPRPAPVSLLGGAVAAPMGTDATSSGGTPRPVGDAVPASDGPASDVTASAVVGADRSTAPDDAADPAVDAPGTPEVGSLLTPEATHADAHLETHPETHPEIAGEATVAADAAASTGDPAAAGDATAVVPKPTLPPARPASVVTPARSSEPTATTGVDLVASAPGAPAAPAAPAASGTPADGSASIGVRDVLRTDATRDASAGVDDPDASGDEGAGPRRRRWPIVVAIVLLLALAGGLVAWFTRTISHDVPDLVGSEQGVALNMISEFDWNVITTEEANDDAPDGVVIRTDPVAGTSLAEGSDLSLVVSTGPAPRELPELAGLTVDDATAALDELGLVLEVGDRPFDEEVPLDQIVSWTVPDQPALVAGDTVLPGTVLVVSVSAGPEPRVVPDLTALSVDDATAQLTALGLVVEVLPEEFSDTVPVGGVARQDPAAGAELERGSTVSIAVSKGQDLVPVPSLADLGVDQARAALEAAGLVLGQVKGDPAGVNVLAEVAGQSIGAGAVFPRGTAIDLTFAVPAPPPTEAAPTA